MQIPAGDEWKVTLAKEILSVKNGHLLIENFSEADTKTILWDILTYISNHLLFSRILVIKHFMFA